MALILQLHKCNLASIYDPGASVYVRNIIHNWEIWLTEPWATHLLRLNELHKTGVSFIPYFFGRLFANYAVLSFI